MELSTVIGHQSGIASKNGNLDNVYFSLTKYQKAIIYYEKGLEICTAIGDQSGMAINYTNLGNAYRNLGESQEAIKYYEKSLEISCAIGDQSGIASTNSNLGIAYVYSGEYKGASLHLPEAIRSLIKSSSILFQMGINCLLQLNILERTAF